MTCSTVSGTLPARGLGTPAGVEAMRTIVAILVMMLAISPAGAQDTIPYAYPQSTGHWVNLDKPEEQRLREEDAAAAAHFACDAGDRAACSALGLAYEQGEGEPQNRPVAELLYRDACNAGVGEGCLRLGRLLMTLGMNYPADEVTLALERGCRLGALEACNEQAERLLLMSGNRAAVVAGEALLRETCERRDISACGVLAERARKAAEQAERLAQSDWHCRSGVGEACHESARLSLQREFGPGPLTKGYLQLGCEAGDAPSCTELGQTVLAGGADPDTRAAALVFFDQACRLAADTCDQAEQIRAEPRLSVQCEGGDFAACRDLGLMLRSGPLKDRPRALGLLGKECERLADGSICFEATELVLDTIEDGNNSASARAEFYLSRSCDTGLYDACRRLVMALLDGVWLPEDTPRAHAILATHCSTDNEDACKLLLSFGMEDPATPVTLAGAGFEPPVSPEGAALPTAEPITWLDPEDEEPVIRCNRSKVLFRGLIYEDTLCPPLRRMRRGFTVPRGTAPWQAMIWQRQPGQLHCGGTVIATGWILTAAHCFFDKQNNPVPTSRFSVRLGVDSLDEGNSGFSYPILKFVSHPSFKPGRKSHAFDVALLRYDSQQGRRGRIAFPARAVEVDPLTLDQRPVRAGTPVFAFGWGLTEVNASTTSRALQGARLFLNGAEECRKFTGFRGTLEGAVLCAAGPKGEQACGGDSGGPLITYDEGQPGPTLIGVISSGVACGTAGIPSRYTRVGRVRDWIAREMALGGASLPRIR